MSRCALVFTAMALAACSSPAFDVAPSPDAVVDSKVEDTTPVDSFVTDTASGDTGADEVIARDAETPGGGAVLLDGATHGILSSSELTYAPGGFTWELWFRPDEVPATTVIGRAQTLISVADNTPCEDIYLGFGSEVTQGRELTFVVDGAGGCGERNATPVKVSGLVNKEWYHVVAVRNYTGNKVSLYVNGIATTETYMRAPIARTTLKANIGRFSDGFSSGAHFKGAIDELAFYSFPMGAADVLAHYNGGKGRPGNAADAGLVTGYHFDEGSGAVARDYSAADRFLTFSAGVKHVTGIVPKP